MSNQSVILPSHSYSDPKLNWLDCVFYFPTLFLPFIIVIPIAISIPLVIWFETKHFHINFCILHFNIIIAHLLVTIPYFGVGLPVIQEWTILPRLLHDSWYVSVILQNFGLDLLRCLWIALFLERMFATIYSDVYETRRFLFVSIVLSALCFVIAAATTFLKFGVGKIVYYAYGIISILDIIGVISISMLKKYNRKIRQIDARSDIKLSQRYQLAENIKSLKLVFPILAVGSTYTFCGTILIWLSMTDFFFAFYRYSIGLYYLLLEMYILISSIVWIRHIIFMDSYLRAKFWKIKRVGTVTPSSNFPIVLSVEGNNLNSNLNIETYFSNLKNDWL